MSYSPESVRNVGVSDQTAGVDSLGFKPYVIAIANFLLNKETQPPLTLSIEGKWGSGKSSFMKQLEKYLRENKKQRTVWFNAWRYDKAEAIWTAFALSFIKQISTPQVQTRQAYYQIFLEYLKLAKSHLNLKKGWLDLLKAVAIALSIIWIGFFVICATLAIPFILLIDGIERFKLFLQAFKHPDQLLQAFVYLLGIAGSGTLFLAGVLILLKKLPTIIGNPKINLIKYFNLVERLKSPDYHKQSALIEEFHEDFAKIVKAYIGDDRVFVFIDDLDRCEHSKSADLMQAINLMIADDPPVVFILGMDRQKIAASLAVKYESILPHLPSETPEIDPDILARHSASKGLAYGYTFIEKFVQLPFQVPQPSQANFERFLDKLGTSSPSKSSVSKILLPSPQFRSFRLTLPDSTTSRKISSKNQEKKKMTSQTKKIKIKQSEQPKNQLSERIKLTFEHDSPTVRDIVMMVAPALDYNPRRIKQFINVFRLKAYIADMTGLFFEEKNNTQEIINHHLTLQQLGKFTAISLRWPLLLLDLETDSQLLRKLQDFALHPYLTISPPDALEELDRDKNVRYWNSYTKLKELIIYGCLETSEEDQTLQINPNFSLATLKVERLLQVSPPIVQATVEPIIETQTTPVKITSLITSLPADFKLEMVEVPGGKFIMGSDEYDSEKPIHKVTVNAFKIGKYPVTQAQYEAVMGTNPSHFAGNPQRPVENVSWFDAQTFCEKLSELTAQKYRLPTEAEWEYACRAGTQTRFSFGDDDSQLGDYAWFKDNSNNKTHPVGEKKANPWELYDMHGNVWEWCEDSWHENYKNAPNNGSSWNENHSQTSARILRGGSWFDVPWSCRSAYRDRYYAVYWFNLIGFRVALFLF
jgi:formylglycine-generating enzyme required for sulfatase activity